MLSGRTAKDEARAQLTTRLMGLFCAVTLVGLGIATARALLRGAPDAAWAPGLTMAALAAVLTVLLLRDFLSLRALRLLEALAFGSVTMYLAARAYGVGTAGLEAGAVPAGWDGLLLRVSLLMVAYGLLMPNSIVRATVGILVIGLAPLLAAGLAFTGSPEPVAAAGDAATILLFETLVWLLTAAGVGIFAAFLTGNLFDFAYEQRRRMFYDLEERIGSGGMGEVWRARHRTLARPTALKLIREDRVTGTDARDARRVLQRFEREAKATAALRSPHTIDVYDYGVTEDGHFFYAMEYLEGLDLETLVEAFGPLPAGRAVHLLMQACDSLADAHESGLTHRDIKPANLFLSRLGPSNDYLTLLDFGLVQEQRDDESERITAEGTASGTPAFMAPEAAVSAEQVDGRADLYALGAVAYWLLTGKLVFEAPSGIAMIVEHVRTRPTPPSRRTELPIPDELEAIVMKCLEKEPGRRFQTPRELADALARVPLDTPWTPADAAAWWDLHRPETATAAAPFTAA